MAKIDAFLKMMGEQGASDMHMAVGAPPILRINGTLKPIEYPPLTDEVLRPMLYEMLTERQIERFEKTHDLDFAYTAPGIARFRANLYLKFTGSAVAFRIIPFTIRTLDEINAPPVFKTLCDYRNGLVLVTGPTGCGKSTTLAALINYINQNADEHILTLEDPLEFIHEPINCLISQREIGAHSDSFTTALRAALREDPDVVLVGEMRDLETIQLAISADRQTQVRTMLAESLRGVICQQLLKRADGNGRIAAFEVLLATQAVRSLIREQKTFQIGSIISTGRKDHMQAMEHNLLELVQKRVVTLDEAIKHSEAPAALMAKINAQAPAESQ